MTLVRFRFSFSVFKSVVCGHRLVTLSLTIIKMALTAAHLNAGVILVVTV